MKRLLGAMALAALGAAAFGQANFTIVRPYDGAHVREKVHILFPMGSIPSGGYVGIFLNGQLLDAVVPRSAGKYYEYVLDTKGRGIPDTHTGKPDRLEAKLFVDYNDQPRITKTSSVDLYVGNQANIRVPSQGIYLRYSFVPHTSMVYNLQQRVAEDTISESENSKGGKPAELPLDTEKLRLLYSVDNSYGNGDGLLRLQALPERGKDYAVITAIQATSLTPETRPFFDNEMASVYMKLSNTGHEEFGSVPPYFAMWGQAGSASTSDLYAVYPLPTLPAKAVRPGDAWQSRILVENVDPSNLLNQTSLVKTFPARGEFVDVEWERDHPCAKITNSIGESEMSEEDRKMLAKGAAFGGNKMKLQETIWFALDTHKILKIVRDETIEAKTEAPRWGGGGPMNGGQTTGGYNGGNEGPGGYDRGGDWTKPANPVNPLNQRPGIGRGMGQRRPGQYGQPQGPGQYGTRAGQPTATVQSQYVRIRIEQTFTLED